MDYGEIDLAGAVVVSAIYEESDQCDRGGVTIVFADGRVLNVDACGCCDSPWVSLMSPEDPASSE